MDATILTALFLSATSAMGLPDGLLSSLCYVESGHNAYAINLKDGPSSSLGVCQIKLDTARLLGFDGTKRELMDPLNNVFYAAKYLKKQINRYHGDVKKAIAAYNAGSYREDEMGVVRNNLYVRKVLLAWKGVRKCTLNSHSKCE